MNVFKRTIATTMVVVLAGTLFGVSKVHAATTKTYTGKEFSFSYTSMWKKDKAKCTSSGCFVQLSPVKSKANQLLRQGSAYVVRVAKLGTKADSLTGEEEDLLEGGYWKEFIEALVDEARESLDPTRISKKSYSLPGYTATIISLSFQQQGATAVVNSVILTKNKKKAYMIQEAWVYTQSANAKNPFTKEFKALAKSFKLL